MGLDADHLLKTFEMSFTIRHEHYHFDGNKEILDEILKLLLDNNLKLKQMALSNQELEQGLKDVNAKLQKIGNETATTLQKVKDLEDALANQPQVTPEVESAFNALKEQAQIVDDMTPDAV